MSEALNPDNKTVLEIVCTSYVLAHIASEISYKKTRLFGSSRHSSADGSSHMFRYVSYFESAHSNTEPPSLNNRYEINHKTTGGLQIGGDGSHDFETRLYVYGVPLDNLLLHSDFDDTIELLDPIDVVARRTETDKHTYEGMVRIAHNCGELVLLATPEPILLQE